MVTAEKYFGRVVKLCFNLSKGISKHTLNGLSQKNKKTLEDVKAKLEQVQTELTHTMRSNGAHRASDLNDLEKICQEGEEVLLALQI